MVLNSKNENISIVIFNSDIAIKKWDIVKGTKFIVDVHEGKALLGHVVDVLGVHIDEKIASSIVIF